MSLLEAAAYIGISERKLWECRKAMKVVRIGTRLIFRRAELDRWLDLLAAQQAA